MSLVTTVQELLNRTLNTDEVQSLNAFQKKFDIDDDDPLMVVLAMMARTQIIVASAPDLLQQKVDVTIELHRTALREQAVIVAKDLVGVLTEKVLDNQSRFTKYAISFAMGVVFTLLTVIVSKYALQYFAH